MQIFPAAAIAVLSHFNYATNYRHLFAGLDGTAVFSYIWPATGAFTITATTLPSGLTPEQDTPFPAVGSGLTFSTGQATPPTLTANPSTQLVSVCWRQ